MGTEQADDLHWMRRAIELARRGEGSVEPNPMVGCVIVRDDEVIAEGWHRRYGDRHAETDALSRAVTDVGGATAYVSLEPCCHHGKQPPCTDALIAAGIRRVVAAVRDPFAKVDGGGLQRLLEAGIIVQTGVGEHEAREVLAPYLKRVVAGMPWVIAKWAMSLDGRLATRTGDSKWISGAASRAEVHHLRGRCDAIVVGIGTALADDPSLTARPAGARTALRVVLDSKARLPLHSQLVRTAREFPTCVACGPEASEAAVASLRSAGVEVLTWEHAGVWERTEATLRCLAERGITNVLVEGGAAVLGSLWDHQAIDEVMVFIAPKLIGGRDAISPIGGWGLAFIGQIPELHALSTLVLERDVMIRGRVLRQGS